MILSPNPNLLGTGKASHASQFLLLLLHTTAPLLGQSQVSDLSASVATNSLDEEPECWASYFVLQEPACQASVFLQEGYRLFALTTEERAITLRNLTKTGDVAGPHRLSDNVDHRKLGDRVVPFPIAFWLSYLGILAIIVVHEIFVTSGRKPLLSQPRPQSSISIQVLHLWHWTQTFMCLAMQVPLSLDFAIAMGQDATMSGLFLSLGGVSGLTGCIIGAYVFHDDDRWDQRWVRRALIVIPNICALLGLAQIRTLQWVAGQDLKTRKQAFWVMLAAGQISSLLGGSMALPGGIIWNKLTPNKDKTFWMILTQAAKQIGLVLGPGVGALVTWRVQGAGSRVSPVCMQAWMSLCLTSIGAVTGMLYAFYCPTEILQEQTDNTLPFSPPPSLRSPRGSPRSLPRDRVEARTYSKARPKCARLGCSFLRDSSHGLDYCCYDCQHERGHSRCCERLRAKCARPDCKFMRHSTQAHEYCCHDCQLGCGHNLLCECEEPGKVRLEPMPEDLDAEDRERMVWNLLWYSFERPLTMGAVEVATVMLLEVQYGWSREKTGIVFTLIALLGSVLSLFSAYAIRYQLLEESRVLYWGGLGGLLGCVLLFDFKKNLGLWTLLIADPLIYGCALTSCGIAEGWAARAAMPGTKVSFEAYRLRDIVYNSVARMLAPCVARFLVDVGGRNSYALLQLTAVGLSTHTIMRSCQLIWNHTQKRKAKMMLKPVAKNGKQEPP